MDYTAYCPKCNAELPVDVEIGEHFFDVPEDCEECGYHLSDTDICKIIEKAEEHVIASAYDYYED